MAETDGWLKRTGRQRSPQPTLLRVQRAVTHRTEFNPVLSQLRVPRERTRHQVSWQEKTSVELTIKKVSENDAGERFVLVEPRTRSVVTVHDTSEGALRRFFAARGIQSELVDQCLQRARQRYATASESQPVVDHAADTSEDDLLAGMGLDDAL